MKYVWIFLLIFQGFSSYLFFSDHKKNIRAKLLPKKESLLSVIEGDLTGEGHNIRILKFKTAQGIRMEFLQKNEETGIREVIYEAEMNNHYNGFFQYQGQSVQLGLGDVDGDGVLEVLAPSFDTQMVAHLNIYTYDKDHRIFMQNSSFGSFSENSF